jgi:hypothetical protein
MSKVDHKKIVKIIRKESDPIFAKALITAATRVGNEMNGAVSDENQSSRILLGKIATTLRSGAIAAGQEMLMSGLESMKKKLT